MKRVIKTFERFLNEDFATPGKLPGKDFELGPPKDKASPEAWMEPYDINKLDLPVWDGKAVDKQSIVWFDSTEYPSDRVYGAVLATTGRTGANEGITIIPIPLGTEIGSIVARGYTHYIWKEGGVRADFAQPGLLPGEDVELPKSGVKQDFAQPGWLPTEDIEL